MRHGIGTAEKGDGQIERLSSLPEGRARFGEAAILGNAEEVRRS